MSQDKAPDLTKCPWCDQHYDAERELSEAREKLNAMGQCLKDEIAQSTYSRERAEAAEQKLEAYQTVLNLIGERLPDCPVIGDYPGGIDLLKQKLERMDALLREAMAEFGNISAYAHKTDAVANWANDLYERIQKELEPRPCICPYDEKPQVCQRKYALSECLASAQRRRELG